MANTCVSTIKVTGDGRERIKTLFDNAAVPTGYGCAWDLNEHEAVILCDTQDGDGITVEQDAIIIKGECKWSPPLALVLKLSEEHSGLTFEVSGNDLTNLHYQRWQFQNGHGSLLDCIEEAYYDEDEETVYAINGIQLLPLPEWVAVADRDMPEGRVDPRENTYEA